MTPILGKQVGASAGARNGEIGIRAGAAGSLPPKFCLVRPSHDGYSVLEIPLMRKIDGNDHCYEQIDDSVNQHCSARRGNIRKRTELEIPSERRLHFER